jgi:predicted nucleic acid-binding protein
VGETDGVSADTGRTAGRLLGRAGSASTIDALVVAAAIERGGAVIMTGDPDDLASLADGHPEVVVRPL